MTERTLDRRPTPYDPRMEAYRIRQLIAPSARPRNYTWRCDVVLDQGSEGACVGFAWSHEAAARPDVRKGITNATALALYRAAQKLDEWPGEDYSGTSVNAGAKAARAAGQLVEYRWATGAADVLLALGHSGPGVFGIDWYDGMFSPGADGYVRPTGSVAGGHAILAKAVHIEWGSGSKEDRQGPDWFSHVDQFRSYVVLHNSWGPDWGRDGAAYLAVADVARLLGDGGEFCVPVKRR